MTKGNTWRNSKMDSIGHPESVLFFNLLEIVIQHY
jgi:hypothetical protein